MLREKGVYFLRTCCVVARDNSNAWAGVLFGFPAPPPPSAGPRSALALRTRQLLRAHDKRHGGGEDPRRRLTTLPPR